MTPLTPVLAHSAVKGNGEIRTEILCERRISASAQHWRFIDVNHNENRRVLCPPPSHLVWRIKYGKTNSKSLTQITAFHLFK